jgi:predicted O-linked N-acetylglucosamine transferase (SPINDLY family)
MLLQILKRVFNRGPAASLEEATRLFRAGNADDSLDYLQRHASAFPDSPDWLSLTGAAQLQARRYDEAAATLSRAADLAAQRWDLRFQVAQALIAAGQPQRALAAAQHAFRLNPQLAQAALLCGQLCEAGADIDAAADYYRQANALSPSDQLRVKIAMLIPATFSSRPEIRAFREKFESGLRELLVRPARLADPLLEIGHAPSFLAYQGENDRELMQLMAAVYLKCCPGLRFDAAHTLPDAPAAESKRKIRLGILSGSFLNHTLGALTSGALRHLDRERFEVILFCFGTPWTPPPEQAGAADRIVWLPQTIFDARAGIAEARLDALWFIEASLSPIAYFLAFSRLAPVQFTTWGHPVTSGLPAMDYYLSSANVEPGDFRDHYSEQVWLTPANCSYTFYPKPQRPATAAARAEFRLPEAAHLYMCLQSAQKLHPDFDQMLKRILDADPAAQIVITDTPEKPGILPKVLSRMSAAIGSLTMQRVQIVPFQAGEQYFRLLALADVVIDPPCFGAGKTSFDAFALGRPVVTLPGAYARARFTLADYKLMGIEALTASSADDYASIAVRLATDAGFNQSASRDIGARVDRLFDDGGFVRELETFVLHTVTKAGAKPVAREPDTGLVRP